jgi:hypothetical protein
MRSYALLCASPKKLRQADQQTENESESELVYVSSRWPLPSALITSIQDAPTLEQQGHR